MSPQHPFAAAEQSAVHRLQMLPLKIKVVVATICGVLSVLTALTKYVVSRHDGRPAVVRSATALRVDTDTAGNVAGNPPDGASGAIESATTTKPTTTREPATATEPSTTVGAPVKPPTPTPTPPPTPTPTPTPQPTRTTATVRSTTTPSEPSWLEGLREECRQATSAFTQAGQVADVLESLQDFAKLTSVMSADLSTIDRPPPVIQTAIREFDSASNLYDFAAQLFVVNQRDDAVQQATKANAALDRAMASLVRAGAVECG